VTQFQHGSFVLRSFLVVWNPRSIGTVDFRAGDVVMRHEMATPNEPVCASSVTGGVNDDRLAMGSRFQNRMTRRLWQRLSHLPDDPAKVSG
jgi:hypothetical protein